MCPGLCKLMSLTASDAQGDSWIQPFVFCTCCCMYALQSNKQCKEQWKQGVTSTIVLHAGQANKRARPENIEYEAQQAHAEQAPGTCKVAKLDAMLQQKPSSKPAQPKAEDGDCIVYVSLYKACLPASRHGMATVYCQHSALPRSDWYCPACTSDAPPSRCISVSAKNMHAAVWS